MKGVGKHISKIDYTEFYGQLFPSFEEANSFVKKVEEADNMAKVVLHQAARLIWLADNIREISEKRPALQVLFFLITAETVAKIVFDFEGEGKSKEYAFKFFKEICSDTHRQKLSNAFSKCNSEGGYLSLNETVEYLYDVRCDVVHRWKYYNFFLADRDSSYDELNTWKLTNLHPHICEDDLRQIILEGAILGCRKKLEG